MYELSTCKPAHDPALRLDPREWVAYWRGYYFAIGRALAVLEMTARHFAMFEKQRRALRKAARARAGVA